ncbi:MAG: FAD-binding oxidoreductase [Pseudomonadota bacterium]
MSGNLLSRLTDAVGSDNVLTPDQLPAPAWETHQPFLGEYVVCPTTAEAVAKVVRTCADAGRAVVPMSGLTNLVQGCATQATDIGLSMVRLNTIHEVDPVAQTMTADAGVTLRDAQAAAELKGLLFPVDIGARDNCMLGGNVSTNAGGTKVIRYGMTRDSVLGLEAVLADGTVVSSMNRYIKNNSGFDLKHLFIGTEGTLGVITQIVFRLREAPASHNVALVSLERYEDVLDTLQLVRSQLGASLCGFEVMWRSFYSKAKEALAERGVTPALPDDAPFFVIIEAMGADSKGDDQRFEAVLQALFEGGQVADGVIAKSVAEREAIWAVRHEVEWLVRDAYNFDVSLRIADVGPYVERVTAGISAEWPDAFVAAFGHLGDNNVHISVLAPDDRGGEGVSRHIYESLVPYQGAISAEHGIGLEKRPFLGLSRTTEEIALMGALKRFMDPKNTLNPGKVIEIAHGE